MKRTLFFLILTVVVSCSGFAQQEAKQKALKLLELDGTLGRMQRIKSKIGEMIPAENRAAFNKEMDESYPKLYEKLAKIYQDLYSPEDIAAMIDFYETPLGKRMREKMQLLNAKTEVASDLWIKEMQGVFEKYLR